MIFYLGGVRYLTKKTDELMKALKDEKGSLKEYLSENKGEFVSNDVRDFWNRMVKQSGMPKVEIIDRSGCGYNYFYCIINGRKTPSREKTVALALTMHLSLDDCQQALKLSGKAPLYPRSKRDSIIIYGIEHGQSLDEVCSELDRHGEKSLRNIGERNG